MGETGMADEEGNARAGEPSEELLAWLRRQPPPELVEALRAEPEVVSQALDELEQAELVAALRTERSPELKAALQADPEVLRDAFGRLDDAGRAEVFGDALTDEMQEAIRQVHLEARDEALTSFICFVGYPRSGGSIVGALLDAHPNMVVSHELPLFRPLENGEPSDQLAFDDRHEMVSAVIAQSQRSARGGRRGQRVREDGTRYYSSYEVDGGWHGRYDVLLAAGSKNAVESAMASQKYGVEPFFALQDLAGLPLRFVHVARNPWDNVATMRRVHGDRAPVRYEKRLQGVQRIKDAGFPVADVHIDDVIEDTPREVRRLCDFYGVPVHEDHLAGCAAVVADRPSRTSDGIEWSAEDRALIERLVGTYEWLDRYRDLAPTS